MLKVNWPKDAPWQTSPLSPVTATFLPFSYLWHPPSLLHHHSHLSSQEGKYKEPLQIPPYSRLICIISTLLQVTITTAPACTARMGQQGANRCDTVPNKLALSSTSISWTWARGEARSWQGHHEVMIDLQFHKMKQKDGALIIYTQMSICLVLLNPSVHFLIQLAKSKLSWTCWSESLS